MSSRSARTSCRWVPARETAPSSSPPSDQLFIFCLQYLLDKVSVDFGVIHPFRKSHQRLEKYFLGLCYASQSSLSEKHCNLPLFQSFLSFKAQQTSCSFLTTSLTARHTTQAAFSEFPKSLLPYGGMLGYFPQTQFLYRNVSPMSHHLGNFNAFTSFCLSILT